MGGVASSSNTDYEKYRHVHALHLHIERGCKTLTVMRSSQKEGSIIDSWDLVSGELQGCLQMDRSRYSAMCHDSDEIIFARQEAEGPVLESVALPQTLARCMPEEGVS